MKEKEYSELKTKIVSFSIEVTELIKNNVHHDLDLGSIRVDLRRFMVFFQEMEAISYSKNKSIESELEINHESVSIIVEYLSELDDNL